uniref:hypothetical protein n=1 Tax=Thaumasiovibrio occultus TaxID=1891184 RepID=UPI000B35FDA7|nr:hypothetical protein [Thaumasiovibrio occultus]
MTQSLAVEIIDTLQHHFGTTDWLNRGGYLMPDGQLLDLQRDNRALKQFHQAVTQLLPQAMQTEVAELTIIRMMALTGIIRYEAKGRLHLATPPTSAQRQRIFQLMKYSVNPFSMVISHATGITLAERRFTSPAAHELLAFYQAVFDHQQYQLNREEIVCRQHENKWQWVFRPSGQIFAVRSTSECHTIMDAEFLPLSAYLLVP